MSSWALNNITAPDNYTVGSTLDQLPVLDHVNIDVSNSSIYWQLKLSPNLVESMGQWDQEVFMFPGSKTLYRVGIVGVRIRAAVPIANIPATGKQAAVTVEAVQM